MWIRIGCKCGSESGSWIQEVPLMQIRIYKTEIFPFSTLSAVFTSAWRMKIRIQEVLRNGDPDPMPL